MNNTRTIIIFCCILISINFLPFAGIHAQDTAANEVAAPQRELSPKSSIFIGTQIPLQFAAGYAYRFHQKASANVQAGFVSKPYSGFIVDAMEAFGMDKYLAQVIRKSFQSGTVVGVGANLHFGMAYAGAFVQYLHLKGGGITPADAMSVYFKKDFSQFNVNALPLFEFSMQSNIINTGLLFGRRFNLRNPSFGINAEVALAKTVGSKNSFASNRAIVDQTGFARNLYSELDESMREAYLDHGYIPTLNLYLVYRFR
jgi:hypothetical protein